MKKCYNVWVEMNVDGYVQVSAANKAEARAAVQQSLASMLARDALPVIATAPRYFIPISKVEIIK